MRIGELYDNAIDYIVSRSLDNINDEEKEIFEKNALYIMPSQGMTRGNTYNYSMVHIPLSILFITARQDL